MKFKVGVVGVSGYSGRELIRLIVRHPAMEFVAAMDAEEVGEKPLPEIHRISGAFAAWLLSLRRWIA